MTLAVYDRVKETTTIVGTGTATLLGAQTGYQSLAVVGTGNTTPYYIADQSGVNWEVGIGTYTASGTTLARTTVLSSSNAGALVVFPAGTKDVGLTYPAETSVSGGGGGTYPTIQPSLNLDFANTKLLDPRITFVRNSTATYYDGQTSAMAEQNLLIGSQTIGGTGWALGQNIATLNSTTAPDGTTTASSITENATVNNHYVGSTSISVTAGLSYTFSVYLKKGVGATAPQYMQFYAFSAAFNCGINVDLNAGTVYSTLGSVISSSSVSVGSGWYRFIFTATAGSNTTSGNIPAVVFINNNPALGAAPSYLGLVTSDVQAWGAQLEQRSAVTAYTPTTTAAITNYIPVLMTAPAGVARFDCDPISGKSLGLLIEEIRVNSLDFSSSFATSGGVQNNWADTNITRTAAAFIAPDSTQVGIQFTASAANATVISTAAVGSSLARTFSVWLKRISGTGVINYTLDNGATWIAQTITSIVTRYTFAATTDNQQVGFQIVTSGDSIGIWGAQLEAGSFATSYIPTVASTVTRAADQASMTGTNFSSWYNQSQGTILTEYKGNNNAPTASNYGIVAFGPGVYNAANSMTTFINAGGIVVNYNLSGTASSPSAQTRIIEGKVCSSYSSTTISLTNNAGAVTTSATGSSVGGITSMSVGYSTLGLLNGHIRKLSYYPIALSSSNLVALTS